MDSLISSNHYASVLGEPLNLLLHVACRIGAAIVTPFLFQELKKKKNQKYNIKSKKTNFDP